MNLIIVLLATIIITMVLLFAFSIELIHELLKPRRIIIERPVHVNKPVQIVTPTMVHEKIEVSEVQEVPKLSKPEVLKPKLPKLPKLPKPEVLKPELPKPEVPEVQEIQEKEAEKQDTEQEHTEKPKTIEYLNSLNKHANDAQNVHDAQVVRSLGKKYNRLMELHNLHNADAYSDIEKAGISIEEFRLTKINSCMIEFKHFVLTKLSEKTESNRNDLKKIAAVMSEIKKARTIVSLTQGKEIVREDWIFAIIWEHINHTPAEHAGNLRDSLMSQIIDCAVKHDAEMQILNILQGLGFAHGLRVPEYSTVCINGRVGRMLSSMTLIDPDPILGEPEKDESEIANEIYTKVSNLLETSLNAQPDIQQLYVKLDEELTNDELLKVSEFRRSIRKNIENTIMDEYSGLIPKIKLNELIEKSISAI